MRPRPAPPARSQATAISRPAAAPARPPAQVLLTDETENQLLVADLPGGRVVRRITLPADPESVSTSGNGGVVVVVSSTAGKVTLLDRDTLRRIKVLGGFDAPHITALSPDRQHAYITDDVRGTLTAIRLSDAAVTSTVPVGSGAHRLSFSPDQRQLWIALGESADQIAILDTSDPDHPRLISRFSPGFPARDLSFAPHGRRVWITSASGPDAAVFGARDHRLLFLVAVGPARSISSSMAATHIPPAATVRSSSTSTQPPDACSSAPACPMDPSSSTSLTATWRAPRCCAAR